jgi:carboxymethylenebutenolidase
VYRLGAEAIAREGYVVLLVHYFDCTGVTEVSSKSISKTDFVAWMDTVRAALSYAAKLPGVDAKHIGLLGFSLGACLALGLAAREELKVAAIVDWFGSLPKELCKGCKRLPPTLVIHGEEDRLVPVEEARAVVSLLQSQKVAHEVKIYPKQGHMFLAKLAAPEALDARQRTLAFLRKYLKKESLAEAARAGPTPAAVGPASKP